MKRGMFVTIVALVVAFALGGATVQAQTLNSDRRVTAKIDFAFVAGSKDMAAGSYGFEVSPAGPVIVTGPDGSREVLPVITTLGRHDRDPDPEFVFDKIGGKFLLSEVWTDCCFSRARQPTSTAWWAARTRKSSGRTISRIRRRPRTRAADASCSP
jgi:hypothetical protein